MKTVFALAINDGAGRVSTFFGRMPLSGLEAWPGGSPHTIKHTKTV
jgi:hypothetical protein